MWKLKQVNYQDGDYQQYVIIRMLRLQEIKTTSTMR